MESNPVSKFANKRNRAMRAQDKRDVSVLLLEGKTEREIVKWIKENRTYTLSVGSVHTICRAVHADWLRETTMNLDEMKARDIAKLQLLERQAADAYARSLTEAERTHQEQVTEGVDSAGKPIVKKARVVVTKERRDGDARFLEVQKGCIQERARIAGYAAAAKVELSGASGGPVKVEQKVDASIDIDGLQQVARTMFGFPKSNGHTESVHPAQPDR